MRFQIDVERMTKLDAALQKVPRFRSHEKQPCSVPADRIYIAPLREGSDDCWDGFTWRGRDSRWTMLPQAPRHCAPWTGTSDREVLDNLARGD